MTMNDYNNEGYVSTTMREYTDILWCRNSHVCWKIPSADFI